MENNLYESVYINDYQYSPKYRKTLTFSRIGDIIYDWHLKNKDETVKIINNFISFKKQYEKIPLNAKETKTPQWKNIYLSSLDAVSLYGFVSKKNPRYYVEVGSGNSTLFAARAILDNNLRTKIISIDPNPRADCNELCYKIYRMPLEEMELNFFDTLTNEDILMVDNSHRAFPNSDVTVFFTEILPRLPAGLLYTLHDIFLPDDYIERWTVTEKRWYNEQYLLCAYLLGGGDGDKIVFPVSYISRQVDYADVLKPLFGKGELLSDIGLYGGLFWIEKS